MKKTFTLVMALSLVMSLMAVPNRIASPFAPKGKVQVEAGQNKKMVKKPVRKIVMESSTTFSFASIADTAQVEDDIKLTLAKGGGQNAPAWNDKSSHLRMYANNTLTISGEGITGVEITWTKAAKAYADLSVNTGDLTSGGTSTSTTDEVTDTWEGEADKVVFTLGASGQRAIKEVVVTVEGEPIVPKDTLYATVNNAGFELDDLYYDWFGQIFGYVYGGDTLTDYFEADFAFEEEIEDLAGTYTQKDMYEYYVIYQGKDVDVKKISLTVNPAEGLNRTAKAEVLGKDTILYIYDIKYIVPEKANDTVYVNFSENGQIYHYAYGDYYFYAEKQDTLFTLDIYTDKVAGEYTTEDIDTYYTYLVSTAGKDTIYTQYYTINTKIEEQAGMYNVTAEMLAYDTILYVMQFAVAVPVASSTKNLTMEGEFEEDFDYYGMWFAEGATADGKYALAAYTYADQATGTWTLEDLYGMQVLDIVAPGDTAAYMVYDLQSLVTKFNAAEDSIILTTAFLGQNESEYVQFNITMTCPYVPSPTEVYITSLDSADAYYYKEEESGSYYWDFFLYTNSEYYAPSVYWMPNSEAKSKTSIAGEYDMYYAEYVEEAGDTTYTMTDEDAYLKITYNPSSKDYTFEGQFVGDEDGVTYYINVTVPVVAYDVNNDYAVIDLNEETGLKVVKGAVRGDGKYLMKDNLFIKKNGVVYNAQGQVVK